MSLIFSQISNKNANISGSAQSSKAFTLRQQNIPDLHLELGTCSCGLHIKYLIAESKLLEKKGYNGVHCKWHVYICAVSFDCVGFWFIWEAVGSIKILHAWHQFPLYFFGQQTVENKNTVVLCEKKKSDNAFLAILYRTSFVTKVSGFHIAASDPRASHSQITRLAILFPAPCIHVMKRTPNETVLDWETLWLKVLERHTPNLILHRGRNLLCSCRMLWINAAIIWWNNWSKHDWSLWILHSWNLSCSAV